MAAHAAERQRQRVRAAHRRDSVLRGHADQLHEIAAIEGRTERAEEARTQRARQEACAAQFDSETKEELRRLTGVLRAAATEDPRDVSWFRNALVDDDPPTLDDVVAPPRPEWAQYAPPPPGLFGRRRHERALVTARAELDEALARHDRMLERGLAALMREYEARSNQKRAAHEAEWDRMTAAIDAADADAIGAFAGMVLAASPALHGLLEGGRATYENAGRELVLEIDIPDSDVVPTTSGWKYVAARKAVEPTPRRSADAAEVYAGLVAQLVLAVLDACFRATPARTVDAVSVNGHVRTTNPATGLPDHPCLITVTADRATFEEGLDLLHPKLKPKDCLRKLGAEMSPHPHDLEHIAPIVDFEMAKYRIAHGPEALAQLDHRMDLLAMNPYEFERLVRDLFTKMGYDTWRTESCRDDGIDAVATKSDPHMPVECIVQAKRFKGAVAPKEVQALMGAMTEKPTATHGYLVTTSWLSPRSRQRARGQRIHTIERNQLAAMIKDLLGFDVVISNTPPPGRSRGDDGSRESPGRTAATGRRPRRARPQEPAGEEGAS
ncbi:restriction endonuclease [Pseudonocardia hydrocarbonoxydans]|uniref:restriction endonuclease n=1 Tax=Pseudonocardia hydrocarbonoxydans TaxID=76726 RepID=UPI0031D9FAFD